MDCSGLSTIETADKGAELTLRHPDTDEKTDIVFTLAGSDSKRFRTASHRIQNRSLGRGKSKMTAEKLEANAIGLLASCFLGWKNVEDSELFPKKKPECNEENVTEFLKKHPWAKEQADAFIADRANFLQK